MPPDFSLDSAKESHQGEINRQDEQEAWISVPWSPSFDRACISPRLHFHGSSYFQEQQHCSLSHSVGLRVRSVPHILDLGCLTAP